MDKYLDKFVSDDLEHDNYELGDIVIIETKSGSEIIKGEIIEIYIPYNIGHKIISGGDQSDPRKWVLEPNKVKYPFITINGFIYSEWYKGTKNKSPDEKVEVRIASKWYKIKNLNS